MNPAVVAKDADVRHVMAQIARREHLGLGYGERAVLEHGAAFAIDEPDRQPRVLVLARGDAVERVIGEEARPVGDAALVERRAISGVKRLDLEAQEQSVGGRGRAIGAHSSITSRQWR